MNRLGSLVFFYLLTRRGIVYLAVWRFNNYGTLFIDARSVCTFRNYHVCYHHFISLIPLSSLSSLFSKDSVVYFFFLIYFISVCAKKKKKKISLPTTTFSPDHIKHCVYNHYHSHCPPDHHHLILDSNYHSHHFVMTLHYRRQCMRVL